MSRSRHLPSELTKADSSEDSPLRGRYTAAELRPALDNNVAALFILARQLHVQTPRSVVGDALRADIGRRRSALAALVVSSSCTGDGRAPFSRSTRCARCARGVRR